MALAAVRAGAVGGPEGNSAVGRRRCGAVGTPRWKRGNRRYRAAKVWVGNAALRRRSICVAWRRRSTASQARSVGVWRLLLRLRRLTVVRLRLARVMLRAVRPLQRGSRAATERFPAALIWVRWLGRWVHVREVASPVLASTLGSGRRAASRRLSRRASPLRTSRTLRTSGLISLRVNIGRLRCSRGSTAIAGAKQLKTIFDVRVVRVKLGSPLIGIKGIGDLVVTRLVLGQISKAQPRWQNGPYLTNVPRSYQTSEM